MVPRYHLYHLLPSFLISLMLLRTLCLLCSLGSECPNAYGWLMNGEGLIHQREGLIHQYTIEGGFNTPIHHRGRV
ncbi:hypothetical protein B484DRAFT_54078 [Ochromonadaceae sp. CCMP2298]|nr:hypothetical protein B484DRAFT_54078 [Ochromonadaceae sp. CCMP2298]